jgi:hypothetical protein
MKTNRFRSPNGAASGRLCRRGVATKEVVLSAVVVMIFGMGLYFLERDSLGRLHHFVSTMTGSPY